MSNQTVNATATLKDENGNKTSDQREVEIEFDFGSDLSEAVSLYGEDAVFNQYVQAARIGLQALLRRHGEDPNNSNDDLQRIADNWKPGEKRVQRKSTEEKVADLLEGKSPEEVQDILSRVGAGG